MRHTAQNLDSILFLDIETVPAFRSLSEVPDDLRELWIEQNAKKQKRVSEGVQDGQTLSDDSNYCDAGLCGEFGKVICISLGRFHEGIEESNFITKSIFSHNEPEILTQFAEVLQKYPTHVLCAHNGKGFDFPFLGKRFLINRMPLPTQLNIMGLKPWEVPHIDTNELWAFGARGYGRGATLKLLCAVFGVPSPKCDMDGSQVRDVYYEDNDLPRIVKYCEHDVRSLATVFRKMIGV